MTALFYLPPQIRDRVQFFLFLFFSLETPTPPVPCTLVCVVLVLSEEVSHFRPGVYLRIPAEENDYPWCFLKASSIWKGVDKPWTLDSGPIEELPVWCWIFLKTALLFLWIASLNFSLTCFVAQFSLCAMFFLSLWLQKLFDSTRLLMFCSLWANSCAPCNPSQFQCRFLPGSIWGENSKLLCLRPSW